MSAEAHVAFPAAATRRRRRPLAATADAALTAAVRFFFAVVVAGQLLFAFTVASFYGATALRGNLAAWNRSIPHGYVRGDGLGNGMMAAHLFSAVVIMISGLIQLVPQVRRRAPRLHRWNGRVYMATAVSITLAGFYIMFVRGTVGDLAQHVGSALMGVLILLFAGLALRAAMARDIASHRRWALRLYLVVSASLFIRAGIFLSFVLNRGPFGFDPTTFRGPFLTFVSFAQYLVPLAVLELYLLTRERGGAWGRFAMAAVMGALALALGAGVAAVAMIKWVPTIKRAYDGRTSIAATLATTIASTGVEDAVRQYRALKAAAATTYNFDVGELNGLGYELLRGKDTKGAIRIFQLNVEAYPRSSNAFDSLGEAYMKDGNIPQAIANYRRAVEIDPDNSGAALMLRKLGGR